MKTATEKGFTLLELIVALSLSVFVLIGVITVATSMVSYQMTAGMKGAAAGGTIMSLARMQREVEDSTYIMAANPPTSGGDVLRGCNNWSVLGGGVITNTAQAAGECAGNLVTSYTYCVDGNNQLWRHYWCGATCTTPAYTCGSAGGTQQLIVGSKPGFFHSVSYGNYFYRTADNTGVDFHYIVGVGTSTTSGQALAGKTANQNAISYYRVDSRVIANKSYPDGSD